MNTYEVERQNGTTVRVQADRVVEDAERNKVTFYQGEEAVAGFVAVMGFHKV